jgi:diketogulonate reductase-like aldo/keto reductase
MTWKAEQNLRATGWYVSDSNGNPIAEVYERLASIDPETCKARAHLLSASPDLLDACVRTKAILDGWGPGRRGHTLELLHGRLTAAIAKAEAP